ncbi:hypothetical protein ACP3V9_25180, partial [Salmonella enterica]
PSDSTAVSTPAIQKLETATVTEIDLAQEFESSGVRGVLEELDRSLIGLKPVKNRIRETAALLLVERARKALGLAHETP